MSDNLSRRSILSLGTGIALAGLPILAAAKQQTPPAQQADPNATSRLTAGTPSVTGAVAARVEAAEGDQCLQAAGCVAEIRRRLDRLLGRAARAQIDRARRDHLVVLDPVAAQRQPVSEEAITGEAHPASRAAGPGDPDLGRGIQPSLLLEVQNLQDLVGCGEGGEDHRVQARPVALDSVPGRRWFPLQDQPRQSAEGHQPD